VPLEEERSLTAEQRAEFSRLLSLGYLPGSSPIPANTGVVVYDGQRTSDGLNLSTSGHFPGAMLVDMAGHRLHEWRMSFTDAWAEQPGDVPPRSIKSAGYWRRAHLFENGDVLAIFEGLGDHGDVLHTNTVEVLSGRLADRIPAYASGNVLICIRELGAIAVLDLELGTAVWGMDGNWGKPHQPTVLDNGNVLIFDNRGNAGRSQVIEFDPVTFRAAWIHRGESPDDFYSWECGSNQRLPNGNTLITESDRGKAFEVAPDGTIVWKYLNPMRAGDDLEFIATIFELVRLPQDFPLDWLDDGVEARS
jgi:outer membrane protein assembly factor BamB